MFPDSFGVVCVVFVRERKDHSGPGVKNQASCQAINRRTAIFLLHSWIRLDKDGCRRKKEDAFVAAARAVGCCRGFTGTALSMVCAMCGIFLLAQAA